MYKIDLNADLGESFGAYKLGMDEELIPLVTTVNIACGYHAGDPRTMQASVRLARAHNAAVGAHPGLPDRMGFGRRTMAVSPEEAAAYVTYQVGALQAFCASEGVRLQHVKLHGALYNMAARDYDLARAMAEAIARLDGGICLLALSGSEMIRAAECVGIRAVSEVFLDRAYLSDGSLAPRTMPGSMIEDEALAIERAIRMIREGKVLSLDGEEIAIQAESLCLHGDGPKAVDFARRLRESLPRAGIEIAPFAGEARR